jgi:hypothetical protein
MNSWMGTHYMEVDPFTTPKGYRTFVRDNELSVAGAAALWVTMDEHESTIDDGFFLVTMDDSRPFTSFPGNRHNRCYALNFADAHVGIEKMRDGTSRPGFQSGGMTNSDWFYLKEITTIK